MSGAGTDQLQEAQPITQKVFVDFETPTRLRAKAAIAQKSGVGLQTIGSVPNERDSAYNVYVGSVLVRRLDGTGEESVNKDHTPELLPVRASLKGEIPPSGMQSNYDWASLWTLVGFSVVDKRVSEPTTNRTGGFSAWISGHVSNVYHAENVDWLPGTYLKLSVPPLNDADRDAWASGLVYDGETFKRDDMRPTLVTWTPYAFADAISQMRNDFWSNSTLKDVGFSFLDPTQSAALTDKQAIPLSEGRATLFNAWMIVCELEDAGLLNLTSALGDKSADYNTWANGVTLPVRSTQQFKADGTHADLTAAERTTRLQRRIALASQLGLHSQGFTAQGDWKLQSRLIGSTVYGHIKQPPAVKSFLSVQSLLYNSPNLQVTGSPEHTLARMQLYVQDDYETRVRQAMFQECCQVAGKTTEVSRPGYTTEVLMTTL